MKPYSAAVVGCGRIGAQMEADPKRIKPATHAGAYRLSTQTKLAALVDPEPNQLARALALFPGTPTFSDCASMLRDVRPDIVSICTLPGSHRAMVELCATQGVRAILCEKPISENRDDAEHMIESCRKAKSLLFINHMRRYDRILQSARKVIRDQEIGEIQHGTAYYTAGLFNTGTHLVDMMRFFLGDIQWVQGFFEKRMTLPPGDVGVNGWVQFQGNVPVSIQHLEVNDYSIFELRLYGRLGSLVVDRFGFSIERTPVRECVDYTGYKELDIDHRRREGDSRSFMADVVSHMVACLEGKEQPLSRGEDGLATLDALLALKESAENQGKQIPVARQKMPL